MTAPQENVTDDEMQMADPAAPTVPVEVRTEGLSHKLLMTLWGACGAQTIALLVNLVGSGQFDRLEAAQLLGVGLTAAGGALVGYFSRADNQVPA